MPEPTATYHTRLLPIAEWDKLKAFPFAAHGLPDPDLSMILVDELADGTIVGIWAALTAVHLDGLWVDPAHRDSPVAGQLLRGMKAALQERGITTSFTLIQDANVMVLAHKAGFIRAPGDLWILTLPPAEG